MVYDWLWDGREVSMWGQGIEKAAAAHPSSLQNKYKQFAKPWQQYVYLQSYNNA